MMKFASTKDGRDIMRVGGQVMNKMVAKNKITENIVDFVKALKGGQPVAINSSGEWFIEGLVARALRMIPLVEDRKNTQLAQALINSLDEIEKISIRFNSSQKIPFASFIEAAELIASKLIHSHQVGTKFQLLRRIVALKYRLESQNGGLDEQNAQENTLNQLMQVAKEWSLNEVAFCKMDFSSEELEMIALTARHVEFTDLILNDKALRQEFFACVLRDHNEVKPFIQFPATQQKIASSNLQGRIGRMGREQLKISLQECERFQEKILSLPFEGKDINILDDQRVITFRGNYKLTIAEVFEIFKNKNIRVGELEFLQDGIVNWNVHKLGWWNADKNAHEIIDMAKPGWWKQLPLFEIITRQEAKNRYGRHMDGITWNAAASATRGTASLDVDQTHAFLEVAVPLNNGNYAIYDFGKFAIQFPSNLIESLAMACHTVEATIAFPDENVYYTHRQHASRSFALSPDLGMKLMDGIRYDIIKARAGNLIYQIESENCAKWLHESLENVVGEIPNLFKMHILDTESVGVLGFLFETIKRLPKDFHIPALNYIHLLFGASKETWIMENGEIVCRSLSTHRFFKTGEIYLPALLHKQLEAGIIDVVQEVKSEVNEIMHSMVTKTSSEVNLEVAPSNVNNSKVSGISYPGVSSPSVVPLASLKSLLSKYKSNPQAKLKDVRSRLLAFAQAQVLPSNEAPLALAS